MREFKTFDEKSIPKLSINCFDKNIYKNEVVWTYLIGALAKKNKEIYKRIAGFDYSINHSIFFESQPQTPYIGIEGNSYIDMALGALEIRSGTTSGIKYSRYFGNDICFVEAKYLSDLSVKTEHSPIRNQMDRVLENLLCIYGDNMFPNKVVFTLLTPRKFKQTHGTRLYYYKFHEYEKNLKNNKEKLANKIELSLDSKRYNNFEYPISLEKRLDGLTLNWITYEELLEIEYEDLHNIDITNRDVAYKVWKLASRDLLSIT